MKILFLDIDGVLNSRAYDCRRNWNDKTNIDETRLPLVKEIVEKTGAEIVLTSTWRRHLDGAEVLAVIIIRISVFEYRGKKSGRLV